MSDREKKTKIQKPFAYSSTETIPPVSIDGAKIEVRKQLFTERHNSTTKEGAKAAQSTARHKMRVKVSKYILRERMNVCLVCMDLACNTCASRVRSALRSDMGLITHFSTVY